jgi:hypothetical protein
VFAVIFAFDCIVLINITKVVFPSETVMGLTLWALSRIVFGVIVLLAAEQIIASALIAPKNRSSISGKSRDTTMLGLQLYLISIGIQEVLLAGTTFLAIKLDKNMRDNEAKRGQNRLSDEILPGSRSMSYALIFSLAAIATRTTYRLIELSGIFTGYMLVLMHNEVFFYTLECLPVLAALGVWALVETHGLLDQRLSDSARDHAYSYHALSDRL